MCVCAVHVWVDVYAYDHLVLSLMDCPLPLCGAQDGLSCLALALLLHREDIAAALMETRGGGENDGPAMLGVPDKVSQSVRLSEVALRCGRCLEIHSCCCFVVLVCALVCVCL